MIGVKSRRGARRKYVAGLFGLFLCLLMITACVTAGAPGRGSGQREAESEGRAIGVAAAARADTGKRWALVIGNGSYAGMPLRNPVNDANDMAAALEGLGFTVIKRTNASLSQMRQAVRAFSDNIRRGGVGLFYYAGHGVQVDGVNYLIPIGADLKKKFDVPDQCLKARYVLGAMEDARNALNIVILDACRDNPFRSFRGGARGLARMDAPTGSLLAFATAPGSVASDGPGRNGLYTSVLLRHIRTPGLELLSLFNHVGHGVMTASQGAQVPWLNHTPTRSFYFVPAAPAVADKPPPSAPAPSKPQTPLPSSAKVDLGDLKQEAEAREKWNQWQKEMEKAFREVERLEKDARLTPGRKAEAWKRVLSAYGDDNPFSTEDESLRSRMNSRIAHWEALDLAAEKDNLEAEKARLEAERKRREKLEADRLRIEAERRRLEEERKKLAQKPTAASGGRRIRNSIGQEFVLIPAGTFTMGSPSSEPGRDDDETQHQVTISKPFYMMKTEVTVGQWREFVRSTGYRTEAERGDGSYVWIDGKWGRKAGYYWDNPGFSQKDAFPVTCVSWNDVQKFIQWLNKQEGGAKYRLPTEAEWEYACRAGSGSVFPWGNEESKACEYGNVADETTHGGSSWSEKFPCRDGFWFPAPVGSFRVNGFGLHDMIGNVWEWCQDWYGKYPSGSVTDPRGASSGSDRVDRGGGWVSLPRGCRSANRFRYAPGYRFDNLGFRLARNH